MQYQLNQIQIMLNLEQDLLEAKNQIISILTEYQKTSEQKIISDQLNKFVNLLQVIDSFDLNKIKECEAHFKEDIIVRIIQSICEKIKKNQEVKAVKQEPKVVKVEQSKAKIETKRQPRIASKSQQKPSEGGIFAFVRNKFTSKQKKATQMILPDEQPKCYYDPVTKSWIFEGQQPEAPKQIPKPPSAAERKSKQEVKKKSEPESQLNQLTAPPNFQRKSKSGQIGKAKQKVVQKIQTAMVLNEPLSFAKVMETINVKYQTLFSKIKDGVYERHIDLKPQSTGNISQYIEFSQMTLEISQQISINQKKVMEKWGKILASDNKQIQIMERVLKEISDSATVYSETLKNIEKISFKQKIVEVVVQKNISSPQPNYSTQQQSPKEQRYLSQQQQLQLLSLRNKISSYEEKQSQVLNSSLLQQKQLQSIRNQLRAVNKTSQDLSIQNQQLLSEINRLQRVNKEINDQLAMSSNELNARYQATKEQLAEYTKKMSAKVSTMNAKIKELEGQNQILANEKRQLEANLSHERGLSKSSIEKVNTQITVEKSKIQAQLKFYQQRQKQYLKRLKSQSQRDSIIRESELSLNQQNQLLISILEKRLQLSKVAEPQQFGLLNKFYIQAPQKSIILELSDIVSSITETHLDRLEIFNRSYSKLHKKYQQSKEALSRIKSNSVNQNMSLNRSVTKLKSLLETYKIGKQQAQQRSLQMQIQCQKLRKKLHHYKQQDQFNKSYLSRLKSSKLNTSQNQSMISLQEDKEQLVVQISDLQKQLNQKDDLIEKGQKDLEDLLINYQKNQAKLFEVEKKYKESEREARAVKEMKEEYENKIKMLELKLKNQKDRYDEIVNREESRLKNAENNFEKKLKLMKNSVEQSFQREKNLKYYIEQIKTEHERKVNQLQLLHKGIQEQLSLSIKQKQQEIAQVLILLQQSNQDLQTQKQEKQILKSQLADLFETKRELKLKMNELVSQHLKEIAIHEDTQKNTNNMIEAILEKYKSFKRQQDQFTSQYEQKILYLQQSLLSSQTQSAELLQQLNQYTSHIQSLNLHTKQLQKIKQQQKVQHQRQLSHLQHESNTLKAIIHEKTTELAALKKQNLQFQQIIQKMSEDYSRLTSSYEQLSKDKIDADEKLMYKQRQIQTYTNQNSKKSQELMIKTEQIEERDKLMLEREELLVMKTEEMDEIKNQLQKANMELGEKERLIKELENNIELLISEVGNLQSKQNKREELTNLQYKVKYLQNELEKRNTQSKHNLEAMMALNQQISRKEQQINDLAKKNEEFLKNEEELVLTLNSLQQKHEQSLKEIQRLKDEKVLTISNINELQNRLGLKSAEVALLQEKLGEVQRSDIKEQNKDEEIQQQMKCLLLSIDEKENQIEIRKVQLKHKEKQIDRLNQVIKEAMVKIGISEQEQDSLKQRIASQQKIFNTMEDTIRTFSRQNEDLKTSNKKMKEQKNVCILKIQQIQKEKQQLTDLIQSLQNDLNKEKQMERKKDVVVSQIAHDQVQLLDALNSQLLDLKTVNKQQQLEIENVKRLLANLHEQKSAYLSQLQQLKKKSGSISEKDSYIQQLQTQNQQMEKQLQQKQKKILQLEGNLADMTQIIEKIEDKLSNQPATQQNNDAEGNNINQEINQRDNEISILKKKIQEIKIEFVEKQKAYENKIEVLEKDIIGLNSLKSANKRLEDNYRALQDENKLLMDEKVQLIKSNNYLVSINQKLIADKSPHTSNNPKESKIHHPTNPTSSIEKTPQKVQVRDQPKTEKTQSQIKREQKIDPQPQQQQPQNKGFFGTLSSLFLTPTQSNRILKK